MISRNYLTFPLYAPYIIRLFRNWPLYLLNYLSRRKSPAEYWLRNGFCLIDATGTLAGTIAVVFIRKEYGIPVGMKTIVDVGANMGAFALYSAWHSPNARIYCYEPESQNFAYLKQNMIRNSLQNRVRLFRNAVASQSGSRRIFVRESAIHSLVSNGMDERYETVDCTTLGDICETHGLHKIDLLKVNCEGTEYEIFENCSDKYFERITNIRLEYHDIGNRAKNGSYLVNFLINKGFGIQRFSTYPDGSGFIWAKH